MVHWFHSIIAIIITIPHLSIQYYLSWGIPDAILMKPSQRQICETMFVTCPLGRIIFAARRVIKMSIGSSYNKLELFKEPFHTFFC